MDETPKESNPVYSKCLPVQTGSVYTVDMASQQASMVHRSEQPLQGRSGTLSVNIKHLQCGFELCTLIAEIISILYLFYLILNNK